MAGNGTATPGAGIKVSAGQCKLWKELCTSWKVRSALSSTRVKQGGRGRVRMKEAGKGGDNSRMGRSSPEGGGVSSISTHHNLTPILDPIHWT